MAIQTIVILSCVIYFVVDRVFSLALNFHQARKTGLHLIISPITPFTWKWQFSIIIFGSRLQYFRWFRAIDGTCAWKDGDSLHESFGQSFILVSPGLNVLCTCDPKVIEHTLRRWRDFVKPDNVFQILGTFGQNVDTSNGNDWTRHRKITAPCFSERASDTVWHQALEESAALVEKWLRSNEKEITTMIPDTSMLALNVVSAVAFENHEVNKPAPGHTLSLRQSLTTVMSTAISPTLESIVPWFRDSRLQKLLPRQIQELLLAMQEFRQYMDETVARERGKTDVEYAKPNLIRTLIKANDTSNSSKGESRAQLSDLELRGNIFIFTVGGLESTAITLSYSLALLAMHPEIQEWVLEEIEAVLGEEMPYTKVFPRMKRVMAIMYETLRQYGPSPPLPRAHVATNKSYNLPTSSNTEDSKTGGRTITMPPGTQIMLNSWACQASPAYFTDPKTWNPKRWLDAQGELIHPTSESGFYAWGSGPRICPGMKFSQVEYTAVLSSILRKLKVELPVDGPEVTGKWKRGREAVEHVLRDSCADPLLLHVRRPEELRLRMVKR